MYISEAPSEREPERMDEKNVFLESQKRKGMEEAKTRLEKHFALLFRLHHRDSSPARRQQTAAVDLNRRGKSREI